MSKTGEFLLVVVSVILGGVVYSLLNWIPVIGPLMVGVVLGYTVKGGFKRAVAAGVLSVAAGIYIIFHYILGFSLLENTIFLWMFVVWHTVCLFLVIVGSVMGSMISSTSALFSRSRRSTERVWRHPRGEYGGEGDDVKTFIICPGCGHSNPEGTANCSYCGTTLG